MSGQVKNERGGSRAGTLSESESLPGPVWRLKPLILTHLAAAILVASWVLPGSRVWWDQIDVAAFRFLNGSLSLGEWWQILWAMANHRMTDVLSGVLMILLFVSWLWGRPREVQNMKCAAFGALVLFMGAVPMILHPVVRRGIDYTRASPTLVLEDVMRLTTLVPWIDAKDFDRSSFPGDHAFLLTLFAAFFIYLGPRRSAVTASILAFIFVMPRLVGGAHWLTDGLIGGVVPALVAASWLLATPLGYYMSRMLLPLVRGIMMLVPKRLRIPEQG